MLRKAVSRLLQTVDLGASRGPSVQGPRARLTVDLGAPRARASVELFLAASLMPRFHCRVRYGSVRLSPMDTELALHDRTDQFNRVCCAYAQEDLGPETLPQGSPRDRPWSTGRDPHRVGTGFPWESSALLVRVC
ncbi:unnamed protein product [Boreogadus saida]